MRVRVDAPPHDAEWRIEEVGTARGIDRCHLSDLASGRTALVRVPGFYSDEHCRLAVERVYARGLTSYGTALPSGILKIGPAFTEYASDRPAYFDLAPGANDDRKHLFSPPLPDPLTLVMDAVRRAGFEPVRLARESGLGAYFAGIVREINHAALPHFDWAPVYEDGSEVSRVLHQWTWNVYLEVPSEGGDLTVYGRPWDPALIRFKIPGSYGFSEGAVRGAASVTLRPDRGELVIFSSRYFHAVGPVIGEGRRVAASSFFGQLPDGEIVFWS